MAFKNDLNNVKTGFVSFIKALFSFNHKASAESGILRMGDKGPKVEELQRTLRVLELYDYPDSEGYFGSDTRTALINFQRNNNIETSGVADAATMTALDKALDTVYPEIVFKRTMYLKSVGRDVKNLQRVLKSIGYYSQRPTGIFDETTYVAVCGFQNDYGMAVDGKVNARLVNKINSVARSLRPLQLSVEEELKATVTEMTKAEEPENDSVFYHTDAVKVQWHVVNKEWQTGTVKTVTDYKTGASFNMKRTGGIYHVDAEPVTKKDTEILKRVFSETWSWERKPVLLSVSYITTAASVCGMPHGEQTIIGNGVEGHFCIHFYESKDDQTRQADLLHQDAIDKAAQYKTL